METLETLLKKLPPTIEYYTAGDNNFPTKQYANFFLHLHDNNFHTCGYSEYSDELGVIYHLQVIGDNLHYSLIELRILLDQFPKKFKQFQWITESEIKNNLRTRGSTLQ